MQADPVAYSVGCKLVDAAGETNGCDEHDGHCSDNDDGDSSGSDDVALYLETLQCRVSGSTWRCLPEHELSNVPYEYDDAAQAALVGGVALACETLTEGQASAGGDTVIAAPLPTGRTRAAAIATAADEDMNRAQEWDLDSSRAEGAPTDGTAADAPQFSGEGTSDPGNGEVEEGARQPPRSEANEPGGSAAFADGGNASDPEDCRLAERKFDTLQKPIQRSGYRRRQTARKEKPPVSRSLSHALCVRCGTASCCSGCNCDSNRGAVASADAVPPPPSDQQLPAAPSTGALAIAVRAASDDGIRQDGSGAKRRRIVVIGDGDDDNIPAPKAINDRGDSVAGLGTGLPGAVSDYRLCTGSPDLGSCHGESMMAEAEGDVAKPRPEDLRTLPVCGWGETTPAATELLGRLAREIGLDSPRVTPGLYVVHPLQTRGGKWTWSVEQLKKKHPALAEEVRRWHIPHRMRVVQITDPCHPVYNNDIIMRNCEPKQRMLVFTENLTPNTPLSAYFGTIKTQAESDEYVLADMTHGRQLMEAYTHTCDWTELHEGDSEKLVVVGDTRNCLMTYANEIRFWGTCDELWRDVSPIAEDVRRTGCRCECYRGRIANAECVQGIVKYRDLKGNMCYGFFILYYTSKHVQSGEEALIHWDKTGSFFNVIREATNTNRFYKGLQTRLRSQAEQLAESLARLEAAEIEIRRLSELVLQKDGHLERMLSELAALKQWGAPRLNEAASGVATPLPPELSYACLLDELNKLRDEVSALRSERKAGLEATIRVKSQNLKLERLRSNLEEERAAREDVERQLAACRATSNLQLVQLDGCRNELKVLKGQLTAVAAAATKRQMRGAVGRGSMDRRRRDMAAAAAPVLAAATAARPGVAGATATTLAAAAMDDRDLLGYEGRVNMSGGAGAGGGEGACVPSARDLGPAGMLGHPDSGCRRQGQVQVHSMREKGTTDGGPHEAGGARALMGVSSADLLPPRQFDGGGGTAAADRVQWPGVVKLELRHECNGCDRHGPGPPKLGRGECTAGGSSSGSSAKAGPEVPLSAASLRLQAGVKGSKVVLVDLTLDE